MMKRAAGETPIFEVPMYWCSDDDFSRRYTRDLKAYMDRFEREISLPLSRSTRMNLEDSFWRRYVAPWKFNQIVGWLTIYILGSQVRADVWFVNAKRFGRKLRKKHFSLFGKAFEVHTRPTETSATIFASLLEELRDYEKSHSWRRVVLDLECLQNLGPLVNWRRLIYG
jgi:hypothetical protein